MFCATVWMGELTVVCNCARGTQYTFNGVIYVENESYNKIVGIHFLLDGQWRDWNAGYSRSLLTQGGQRVELWTIAGTLTSLSSPATHIQLAAYYHNVDWTLSHWDNNLGSDYFIPVTLH
jgi:hypothetical protein